jgi:CRISPR/Cas system-associated exonuclease Cas4 (RecB family)
MKAFLQHIVDDLDHQNPLALKNKCFVFPSRRGCVYFNDLLQKKFHDKVLWGPTVLSIEEFVQQYTPELTVVDEIRLLFKLYESYKKEAPGIAFDTFYAWGQTLLKDFDEIDRYLVDADLLYKNLQEVENIEAVFGPDEEVIKALKGFQEVIDTSQEGKLYKEFSATWTIIGKVYNEFKASLLKEGWGYNGLCYRILAEKLQAESLDLPFDQVVFAGFNALSRAEQKIIDSLLTKDKALVYIDADRFYLDNEGEEAGYFLRKMKKHWRNNAKVKWILNNGFEQEKSIDIVGVSQRSAQARAAAEKLAHYEAETAIVLADESLLLPVLYALPATEGDLNITMGYPISGSTTGNLIMAFLRYQASASIGANKQAFFSLDAFKELIDQPAINYLLPSEIFNLTLSKSRFMSSQLIAEKIQLANENCQHILTPLFSPNNDISIATGILSQAILDLYLLNKDSEAPHEILDERIIYSVVKYLQNLQGIIAGANLKISFAILEKLVKESFKKMTAPFAGEPLASLQVMGFLETRALDFENIILLSVNEDLLPAPGNANTYIPFSIRKAFQLPTFLEHNSIYAYHFFRLLQRAKNVTLIYSTQLSVIGSGEKSRFILQLLNRFDNEGSPVQIRHINLLPQLSAGEVTQTPLIYEKTGPVLAKLEEHIASFSHKRPLTPTALVDYLTCSLKYYFARILSIREPEEPYAEIDARIFGNILHDILEKVYEPWVGKKITKVNLDSVLKTQLTDIVDEAFKGYDDKSGEISFTKHVILYLARRILQNDIKDAPIKIIDLESKTNPLIYDLPLPNSDTIPLGGKIDRLDQIMVDNQSVTRILDYKTGKVELKKRKYYQKELSIEEYMKAHFEEPKYKSGFQLYFYTLLLKRNYQEQGINGGILGVKKLSKGVDYLRDEPNPLENEVIDEFEQNLVGLLTDLLDKDIPFKQTEDTDRCKYCNFKAICGR